MKKLILILLLIIVTSCEKNCDDEVAAIKLQYYEWISKASNIEQIRHLEREMEAKIRQACD